MEIEYAIFIGLGISMSSKVTVISLKTSFSIFQLNEIF